MHTLFSTVTEILLCGLLYSQTTSGLTGSHSTPAVPATVTQIHIAQGSTPTSMTISWVTASPGVSTLSTRQTHLSDRTYSSNLNNDAVNDALTEPKNSVTAVGNENTDLSSSSRDKTQSIVKYGTDPSNLYLTSSGSSSSYTFNYKGLANYTSGLNHHTFLKNLRPMTIYYYQCGDFSTESSADYSGKYFSDCFVDCVSNFFSLHIKISRNVCYYLS